jgi:hypothetical protein
MKATISNTGREPVPIVPWTGDEPAAGTGLLQPGQTITIDGDDIGRVDIGEVPTFREDLANALAKATSVFAAVIRALLNRPEPRSVQTIGQATTIKVTNNGTAGIRALAGSNVDESEIAPNASADLTAPGETPGSGNWIQLRQLGM